uniref:Uncharacterized protein n=1 Tax=Tanacetum cinerariifolium TaxID=118510 RepID=A0A6L2NKJ3_TANCI|nr:hypothetical protein [Tanacetum cinerariifolium]
MVDDLFTYAIKIPTPSSIPYDKKEEVDSDDEDLDVYETRDNASYHANVEEYEEDRCELLRNPYQEPSVCEIGRFGIIKYSFGPTKKYIAIEECEYDDLTRIKVDVCHAYQEIFRIMDEGWFVIRVE